MERNIYFELVFENLKKNSLLPERQSVWRNDFQKYYNSLSFDSRILFQIKKEYGFGFENVFLVNAKKYTLINQYFHNNKMNNLIYMQTAVYFTVLGCIIDYMLDNGKDEEKIVAKKKLKWTYCGKYFKKFIKAKENTSIDLLYENIAKGFQDIAQKYPKRYKELLKLLKQTIESELYVVNREDVMFVNEKVINKSILFSIIPIKIILSAYNPMTENIEQTIYCMGEVFALIDDLLDIYEDKEKGQKNIILNQLKNPTVNNKNIIIKNIEIIIEDLAFIKRNTNKEIYKFFKNEIQDWVMTCPELRERVWMYYG